MPSNRSGRRLLAALFLVFVSPAIASAQDSRLLVPTLAASTAAAADWATTHHALSNYRVREVNPLLRPYERRPGQLVTVGAVMDGAVFSAWNLTVGQKHPRVAAAGLWGMAAFRTYLAIHNLRNTRKAARR